MLIAHLPSGYLLGRAAAARGLAMGAALLGSVAPDFDMLWFHLVDQRQTHHHEYWPHVPGFWLIVALLVLPVLRLAAPRLLRPAILFLAAVFLHLVLDTLVGGIMWLWPFDDRLITLTVVPARHDHWIISFMMHWSFLAEIAITAAGIWLLMRDLMRWRVATTPGSR
ncbi:MAG: metal-dependent hydrolase [Paracoccus denitrificans]|uniref:Metal-dependent hydrolase n=1 Tax=Paracoccus denitrificans TaxID=266 RepID=A0A533IAY5_PARDE|nr:MAG: metal-dependent hydrolase [Paracoccus denitrificans]